MNRTDLVAILPLIVVGVFSLLVLLEIAIHRHHKAAFLLALAGWIAAFAAVPLSLQVSPRRVTSLMVADRYGCFFTGLILAAGFAVALLAYNYLEKRSEEKEEFYVLLLLATFGSLVLASSSHFISFFLGLDTRAQSINPLACLA